MPFPFGLFPGKWICWLLFQGVTKKTGWNCHHPLNLALIRRRIINGCLDRQKKLGCCLVKIPRPISYTFQCENESLSQKRQCQRESGCWMSWTLTQEEDSIQTMTTGEAPFFLVLKHSGQEATIRKLQTEQNSVLTWNAHRLTSARTFLRLVMHWICPSCRIIISACLPVINTRDL